MAVTVMLAWGIRGQHGHERGAAFVGAAAGLALAAATGVERWVWAALWGSLGFAVGGAVGYGWLVGATLHGSTPALVGLISAGALWGALGGGALGWGYRVGRPRERLFMAALIGVAWGCLDGPLSMQGGALRRVIALTAFAGLVCALLGYYVGYRREAGIRRLVLAGAVGWGVGFPLGARWLAWGPALGWSVDWWKWMEHTIGLTGGLALAWGVLRAPWPTPAPLAPWQRWCSCWWFFVGLPAWLWANNFVYWWHERRIITGVTVGVLAVVCWVFVVGAYLVGASRVRTGVGFQRPWSPAALRGLCLGFVWLGTATAVAKTWLPQPWGPTQTVFVGCAVALTGLLTVKPSMEFR